MENGELLFVNEGALIDAMTRNGISVEKFLAGDLTEREKQLLAPYCVKITNIALPDATLHSLEKREGENKGT